jgi:hypothetical protein
LAFTQEEEPSSGGPVSFLVISMGCINVAEEGEVHAINNCVVSKEI